MGTPIVLKLLRNVVEQNDKAPLSQAEFNLFLVLDQALVLYPDEAKTGKPEPWLNCRTCGALLKDSFAKRNMMTDKPSQNSRPTCVSMEAVRPFSAGQIITCRSWCVPGISSRWTNPCRM